MAGQSANGAGILKRVNGFILTIIGYIRTIRSNTQDKKIGGVS